MSLKRKRVRIALLGVALFGGAVASAATLGGLTSNDLGANDTVVAACDSDGVAIAYTNAYTATSGSGRYTVTSATVSGIAETCVGQTLTVTLRGDAGASLGSGSNVVAGPSEVVTISGSPAAELVTGAAVVIEG